MRFLILSFALFFTVSLSAENLGNLVYNLPPSAKNWEIYKQTASLNSVMVAYAPKSNNGNQNNPPESFVVSLTTQPLVAVDEATIKSNFDANLPESAKVKVDFIEKGTDNMIYEWTITQDNQPQAYGLARAFSLRNGGTALLQYITQNPSDSQNAKTIWLPVLKEAKIVLNQPALQD